MTKGRPGKVNNYEVSGVTKYDDINVVEPLSSPTEFVRRNITTQGVDLLFCEGVGCEVWVRCSRKRSLTVPDILHMINEMNRTPNNVEYESSNTLSNANIKPGKTIFYYDNCALRVNVIFDSIIQYIVLQSSNSDYTTGSFISFKNENEAKDLLTFHSITGITTNWSRTGLNRKNKSVSLLPAHQAVVSQSVARPTIR